MWAFLFMATDIVYLNGNFLPASEAKISVFDRGFLFGDSVYEVIPFYHGVGFRLSEHLDRLHYSLHELGITPPDGLEPILTELVAQNGGGHQSVYLQVTRGAGERRSHAIEPGLMPTVFACTQPIRDIYDEGASQVDGIKVIVTEDLRWKRCDVKANGLLANILVIQKAKAANAAEALLIHEGELTEGASSNFFIVESGVIKTPPLETGILSGTTRSLVLTLAERNGVPYEECRIDYARLINADEVWISSSTRGVMPVLTVDEHTIGDGQKGPIWAQFFEWFIEHQAQTIQALKPE
jgi:D-alanine transaminase